MAGGLAGMGLASAVDASVLAWQPPRAPLLPASGANARLPGARTSSPWVPSLGFARDVGRHTAPTLEIGGAFP
jgi:hypothetical protein